MGWFGSGSPSPGREAVISSADTQEMIVAWLHNIADVHAREGDRAGAKALHGAAQKLSQANIRRAS